MSNMKSEQKFPSKVLHLHCNPKLIILLILCSVIHFR